jgi:Flp pilus assembly protein TadD
MDAGGLVGNGGPFVFAGAFASLPPQMSSAFARSLKLDSRSRAVLWVFLAALPVHLLPFFLPRKVPEQELALARLLPEGKDRLVLLQPLLDNPRATAEDLRQAALLLLPASGEMAEPFLAGAERLGPGQWQNELVRAQLCRARGDASCVRTALGRAQAGAPQSPEPDLAAAELHALDGDPEAALQALARAHLKAPGEVELKLRLVRALGAAGRVQEGELLLQQAAPKLAPETLWAERGKLFLAAGANDRAKEALAQGCKVAPLSAELHFLLGVSLVRLEDLPGATVALREADKLAPRDYRPLALLCAAQREALELDQAAITRMMLQQRFASSTQLFARACP